ncbi:MFS transporter [Streptomyces ureilyticus]|uniref:MFS transporter n=1 Tax=Streptomyces ureilyticus TaxID=1775131 RepID=A0ABX0DTD0_9ACTN|nr:MFS transporter [Streptomyces ureilyticus]NGO42406.1 MFS transporter [Streptomyces ureilyticus]
MPQNDRDISVVGPPPTEPAKGDAEEPTGPATGGGEEPAETPTPEIEAPPLERVSRSYLGWIMIASFGVSLALMVPLSYSLALRIDELAPGREELLGYVTGSAQFVYLILSPLMGIWSDRMRSRLGRRTPFMFAGTVIGMVGLLGIAVAPTVFLVGLAWVVGMVGWSTVGQAIQNVQADRVPEEQRGRVSAVTGVMTQIAPVIGIGIAYTVASSTLLVFLVPGALGAAMLLLFPLLKPEGDSRALVHTSEVSLKGLVTSYGFNPRKYPDFGWNWLGRFIFFMGLYFNTTFGTFFYAQRLDMPVKEVAGVVSAIGILGVLAAAGGAIGGGFLSDKLGRRKLFTMIGSAIFVAGAVAEAFAHSLPQLVVGAVLMQLAIAMFSAVDQAIVFAVLPDRAQAGRYLAVVAFAQKIPSALAPLIAPLVITIGVTSGGEKNYTLLYLSGAVLALAGGLIIKFKIKSVR